jgi:hypothetical protein
MKKKKKMEMIKARYKEIKISMKKNHKIMLNLPLFKIQIFRKIIFQKSKRKCNLKELKNLFLDNLMNTLKTLKYILIELGYL